MKRAFLIHAVVVKRHCTWKERRNAGCYTSGSLFDSPESPDRGESGDSTVAADAADRPSGVRFSPLELSPEATFQFDSDRQQPIIQGSGGGEVVGVVCLSSVK